MSDQMIERPERRHPMELQLTAMIDVFSMIVIFLILGTVFGASEMVIPPGMTLPKSLSKEGVESAPRLNIADGKITGSFFGETLPLSAFQAPDGSAEMLNLQKKLRSRLQENAKQAKPTLLNTIADGRTPYEDVFAVTRVFRMIGFESILFVATGEPGSK